MARRTASGSKRSSSTRSAPEQGRAVGVGERARVVERRAHQVGAVGAVAEALPQHEHPAAADVARRRTLGRRAAHPLRTARRARRVEHGGADDLLLEIVARERVDVGPRRGSRRWHPPTAKRRWAGTSSAAPAARSAKRASTTRTSASQFSDHVGDLVGRPPPRHRGETATGPRRAPIGGQVLRDVAA